MVFNCVFTVDGGNLCSFFPLDVKWISIPVEVSSGVNSPLGTSGCPVVILSLFFSQVSAEFFLPVVSPELVRFNNQEFSKESEEHKDQSLPDRSVHDVLDHSSGDKVIVTVLGISLQEFVTRVLGSESESSKGVHDQVDPQKLDSVKG